MSAIGDQTGPPAVEIAPAVDPWRRQLIEDVRTGFAARSRWLPPKYFYDARGSALFERITRLPEYYPTRAERTILAREASAIATATRAETLIELGSGTSEKTRLLIAALRNGGGLRRFIPLDVDPSVLASAATAISAQYPGLQVEPVVGDFQHLELPAGRRRLVAFLGSTIGNLDPGERAAFFAELRSGLEVGDALLLGTDLVKDPNRLLSAYDDPAGVTAAFNRNVLRVLNRELGADFDPDAFAHRAHWDPERAWIEMRLRSERVQTVRLPGADLVVDFAAGEELRTEISAKFTKATMVAELGAAGLGMSHWWTDPAGDFALSLSEPV